jgi:hypothetical protein
MLNTVPTHKASLFYKDSEPFRSVLIAALLLPDQAAAAELDRGRSVCAELCFAHGRAGFLEACPEANGYLRALGRTFLVAALLRSAASARQKAATDTELSETWEQCAHSWHESFAGGLHRRSCISSLSAIHISIIALNLCLQIDKVRLQTC